MIDDGIGSREARHSAAGQLDIASECWFGGRVAGGSDPVVTAVYAAPAGAVRCRHLTWMSWLRIAKWK